MSLKDYQTKDAKYQLLYEDRWKRYDERPLVGGEIIDDVAVKLIVWSTSWQEMFVLLSRVIVDCEEVVVSAKVLDGTTISDAVKAAIAQFEELLEAHPSMPLSTE